MCCWARRSKNSRRRHRPRSCLSQHLGRGSLRDMRWTTHTQASYTRTSSAILTYTVVRRIIQARTKRRTTSRTDCHYSSDTHTFHRVSINAQPQSYTDMRLALFMGLAVSILLLSILWVGVSAIAGLEVSYMAFSKEMSQQKPQKQQ